MQTFLLVLGVDLGRDKLQSNGGKSGKGDSAHRISLTHLRDTEVAQKYCAIGVQEDVLELQIAVHHADRVQEILPSGGDCACVMA